MRSAADILVPAGAVTPVVEPGDGSPVSGVCERRLTRIDGLHGEMGRIAQVTLPDSCVQGVVSNLHGWDYEVALGEQGGSCTLRRRLLDESVEIELSAEGTSGGDRTACRNENGITIATSGITGGDMQYALGIERQIVEAALEVARFAEVEGSFVREGEVFTAKESLALAYTTHDRTFAEMARTFRVPEKSMTRLLKPARERTGAETVTDLMIVAVADGVAEVDHIPEGKTVGMSELHRTMLAAYYSPDPEERKTARQQNFRVNRWSRMFDGLGIDRAHTKMPRRLAILYAIKDGVIKLPDLDAIRAPAPVSA